MRKVLSLMLVLCMLCSAMTVTAFAAYSDDANHVTGDTAANTDTMGEEAPDDAKNGDEIGSFDIPVYVETEHEENVTNVYAVSYDLDEVTFVFSATTETIWNPETLKYESVTTGDWNATSQDITVTNYSDIPVKVTPSNTTPADAGITVTLGNALELASAFNGDRAVAGTAKSGVINVSITGEPTDMKTEQRTLLTTLTMTVTDNRK